MLLTRSLPVRNLLNLGKLKYIVCATHGACRPYWSIMIIAWGREGDREKEREKKSHWVTGGGGGGGKKSYTDVSKPSPETKTALGYAAIEIRRGVIVLARNRNFPKEKGTSCAPYIPGIAGSSEKIRIARENDTYKYTQDSSAVSADLARGVACVYSTPGLGIFLKVGGIPLR